MGLLRLNGVSKRFRRGAEDVVALDIVLVAAALPAWRTSRLEVVESLRYE